MNITSTQLPLTPPTKSTELRTGNTSTQPTSAQSSVNFNELLDSLNQTQTDSDTLMQKLAAGEDVDLHQVMIASEQTDISFRVALAIRDKLVDAYREVMRMSV
jgi:flagellar hook-basal body complex protein FliE